MQFESDYRLGMDDSFSLCSQPMSCPSTTTSFSSTSSAYDPFTPISRQLTPHEFGNMHFGVPYNSVSHRTELTPSSSAMGKFIFGLVKTEPEIMPFRDTLPNTPMKREQLSFEYKYMMDMNMTFYGSMGSLIPSNSFGVYGHSPGASIGAPPFMMTPTQSLSGPEATETGLSWSCANDGPISSLHNKKLLSGFDSTDLDPHSQSPLGYSLHEPISPNHMRAQKKIMVKVRQKSDKTKKPKIQSSRKRSIKSDPGQADAVRRARYKCNYRGCHKGFRRNEHLRRHKQTYHGEGRNRFSCEFCRKDQFNRQDNLNNHRRLHARPNNRNRGVEFIPAAVPVIEQEERSRKRRDRSKPPTAEEAMEGKEDSLKIAGMPCLEANDA
ncbi:hypothetical protein HZS61_008816 [Fusarium oxysporum f. sp. conglutinans]|uniref:C2H2-type domain-containing protein n=4 Tax=Fusarium oxysporum TaxID=5507 RepID=A0A8H6LQB7_FUSOX|nr:hypothetical protein FOXB_12466 [Fusarium oxysporum f. sp. conglutinans Fo5176]KAF6528514.1 hypothetical protein HZS61_008816 [Fusarium oxysporum f. sp. conglutinans]KAG7428946.1 C2H2 type master regulator of conidiophore development brlA [Fusarium oxysporum f. sp. raphani]KAH7465225.1 C2H2 type master regulator of conidiophore development [Fusarium oxysporum f. sp. matthiolae]KAI8416173.1 hypothetical protein FOFC_02482 [Fusarium oxysporum]